MKPLTDTVCLDDEVKAIAAYITLKWSPVANLERLVQDVRVTAEHAARALFQDHPVWEVVGAAEDAREAMLIQKYGDGQPTLMYYDAGCQLLSNIERGLKDARAAALNIDGSWDYESRVDNLVAAVEPLYAGLAGARPNGWAELEVGYNDFDGQEEYSGRADRELFQGTKVESVLSGDFVFRTALPYVMSDEKCQAREAHNVLVGAIYSQFLLITEHLNTKSICKDLQAVVASFPNDLVFDLKIEPQTPVLKTLIKAGKPFVTRAKYEEAVAQAMAYDALSDEAKALKAKESEDRLASFMAELSTPKSRQQDKAEDDLRIASIIALLKLAIGERATQGGDEASPTVVPRMRA